jgi:site-specific DNA-methyltransferase (adenine-specific)
MDLRCGDALDVLRSLPDRSVNLVATDPPYFRAIDAAWDNAWKDSASFLSWLGTVADEWRRVLTDNGSVYCFASPRMAAPVQMMLAERFTILNEVVWAKPGAGRSGQVSKKSLRAYFPNTERLIVAEQVGADGSVMRASGYAAACQTLHAGVFEPLRQYLITERDAAGITNRQVDAALGTNGMAGHYFGASQWALPTAAHYATMQRLFNTNGTDHLRREYDDLRREYDDLRRPFTVSADVPYTDVWTYPTVPSARRGEVRHPCTKPLEMMEHIVATSSRPGDVVLDCFLGSGSTAVAARNLGRDFIGCDMDELWVQRTRQRLDGSERSKDKVKAPYVELTLFSLEVAS